MSQYHQGPPFRVSSSPIFPLDAHPARSRRPSHLALEPHLSLPGHQEESSKSIGAPAVPDSQHYHGASPPDSARSISADWISDALSVDLDLSRFDPQQRRGSFDSTGTPLHSLPRTPVDWETPLNLEPYAPPFHATSAGNSTTFFYRSPTPSARQRTNQACEKCRDRKTKVDSHAPRHATV